MGSWRREREGGTSLIIVALCIVAFIGMAAPAVDEGVLYTARTSAQRQYVRALGPTPGLGSNGAGGTVRLPLRSGWGEHRRHHESGS